MTDADARKIVAQLRGLFPRWKPQNPELDQWISTLTIRSDFKACEIAAGELFNEKSSMTPEPSPKRFWELARGRVTRSTQAGEAGRPPVLAWILGRRPDRPDRIIPLFQPCARQRDGSLEFVQVDVTATLDTFARTYGGEWSVMQEAEA